MNFNDYAENIEAVIDNWEYSLDDDEENILDDLRVVMRGTITPQAIRAIIKDWEHQFNRDIYTILNDLEDMAEEMEERTKEAA